MNRTARTAAALLALALLGAANGSAQDAHDDHAGHDHSVHDESRDDHAGHDHAVPEADDHAGHDHAAEADDHDDHSGHDHSGHGHSDEVRLTPEAMKLFKIELRAAGTRVLLDSVDAPARVAFNAEAMAHVGTPISGHIREIAVRLGDRVEKGDLLLALDSAELAEAESDFLQKRSAVDVARTDVEVARIALERSEKLREANGVSITEHLAVQGALRKAEGALKVAEGAALGAENRLHIFGLDQAVVDEIARTGEVSNRFEVRAPIAGEVIEREVTPGEVVDPEQEAMLVLADRSTLWVLADVPERFATRVVPGSEATILAGPDAATRIPATVSYVAPMLDTRTRTAQARLVVEGVPSLMPGMFVSVEIAVGAQGETAPVLSILEEAVQTHEGRDVVFVPSGEPNTFKPQPVVLGPRVGRFVAVESGLAEGDPYVAEGSFLMKAELGKEGVAHEH